ATRGPDGVEKQKPCANLERKGESRTRPQATPTKSRVAPATPAIRRPEPASTMPRARPVRTGMAAPAPRLAVKASAVPRPPVVKPTPLARPTGKHTTSAVPALKPSGVARAVTPKPLPLPTEPAANSMTRSPVALRAEKPAQEPPALPALEGATIAGEVDSIPSLRALSVKSDGGDAALDDGPTPPPVSRSHRASERAPAAAATGGRRSRWGGG